MYKHILVPLDQSDLAEQALPHAVALASALHAQVTLVGVVDVLDTEAAHEAGVTLDWEAQVHDLGAYLQALCCRLGEGGVPCHWEVLQGAVADEILRFAAENQCDLIVMATHGRSELGHWVHGSLADQLLAQTPAPILLVRAEE
jgi:nucleotide-binding universal stress UspA family protein